MKVENTKSDSSENDSCLDINKAKSYIDGINGLWDKRLQIKSDKNSKKYEYTGKKETSIKKITTFIKKIKLFSEHTNNMDSFCKEMQKLNLNRYISEIISALVEAKLTRTIDVVFIAQICILIQNGYKNFSTDLELALLKTFEKKIKPNLDDISIEKENQLIISKQRIHLRLITELVFVGLLNELFLIDLLKNLIKKDKGNDPTFSIAHLITGFCKYAGEECVGHLSKMSIDYLKALSLDPVPKLRTIKESSQSEISNIIVKYFSILKNRLIKINKFKIKMEKDNNKILLSKGEIGFRRSEKFKKCLNVFNELKSVLSLMCEYLNFKMPKVEKTKKDILNLYDIDDSYKECSHKIEKQGILLYGNEETRAFYEDIPNLKETLPSMLFIKKQCSSNNDEMNDFIKNIIMKMINSLFEVMEIYNKIDESVNEDTQSNYIKNKSDGINSLIDELINGKINTEKIDELSKRYCMFNSKKNRNRLIETLMNIKKSQINNISYYSRMIATLNKCFPEIGGIINMVLEKKFNFLFFKKTHSLLNVKFNNIIYISELVKFQIFPTDRIFAILKRCLRKFTSHEIQIACRIFDNCGRWLYKNPKTTYKCKALLNNMVRKKKVHFIEKGLTYLIDNADYNCHPEDFVVKREKKVLPPEKAYIQHLLYKLLNNNNIKYVSNKLRNMNWNDPDISNYIKMSLFSIINSSYDKVHLIAPIISLLDRFYNVSLPIVDSVLEEIRVGLEEEFVGQFQRQMIYVKFLGDLYIYHLVDVQTILDTLYLLITFKESDSCNEISRIRLVCTLFSTCGKYFRNKRYMKSNRLIRFLIYFQRYILVCNAKTPLEIEIENFIEKTFKIFGSKIKIYKDLQELEEIIKIYTRNKNHRDHLTPISEEQQDYMNIEIPEENIYETDLYITTAENDIDKGIVIDSDDGDDWERGESKKTAEDIEFENSFDKIIKETIEVRKFETQTMNINNASAYSHFNPKNVIRNKTNDEAIFRIITRGKKKSKPITREFLIPVKEKFKSMSEEDKKKKEIEDKLIAKVTMRGVERNEMEEEKGRFVLSKEKDMIDNKTYDTLNTGRYQNTNKFKLNCGFKNTFTESDSNYHRKIRKNKIKKY